MAAAIIHATAVAIRGQGLLMTGPSGAGKSDLALRLIDRGAILIADDRVELARESDRLLASPPASIAGLVEMRGVGIVARPHVRQVPVALILDLASPVERLPPSPDAWQRRVELGIGVPVLPLNPFEPVAPLKAEAALQRLLAARGRGDG